MKKLPIIICTDVIRSSKQGDSHGGVYLVDLENDITKQVINWNDTEIDWEGRGGGRGLRGIAFYNELIIIAASDEIFFYDQGFNIIKSFRNKYLKNCHEIFVKDNYLYLSSTGFDSILKFDLKKEKFILGFLYRKKNNWPKNRYLMSLYLRLGVSKSFFKLFDPNKNEGPLYSDTNHINNVFVKEGSIYFSGVRLNKLYGINEKNKNIFIADEVPYGTHNVHLHKNVLIFNNTVNDSISIKNYRNKVTDEIIINKINETELMNSNIPKDHARNGFARGLCFYNDLIIGGSSPSTISVYSFKDKRIIKSINLTKDVRNAIHGLEVYPFIVKFR